MRVLVDTNILLRSAQPDHPLCSNATPAVAKLMRDEHSVFVCAQNIAEFWNVATRPLNLNGLGLSHEQVLREINSIEGLFTFLADIPAVYPVWRGVVEKYRVLGVKVYDARLVALMTVYSVESVLTFNAADFKRYNGVTALDPASIMT